MTRNVTPMAMTRIAAIETVSRARRPEGRSRRSATVREPVPHRAHRVDWRRAAVQRQLPAQVPDVHLYDVGPRIEVISPHATQELLARQHLVLVTQEIHEQVELPS